MYEDQLTLVEAGDCIHQHPGIVHYLFDYSKDMEYLEVARPANFDIDRADFGRDPIGSGTGYRLARTLSHAVVFLLVMLASPAISKDFGILTRMFYAAFLAEEGVALCIVADPAFANETRGPMGYMHDYVTHIKAEVTAGLNEGETLSLVKSAADRAKGEALQAIRSLRTGGTEGPEIETARVTRWCQTVVKPLVWQVIDMHDHHHAEIDQLLEKTNKD